MNGSARVALGADEREKLERRAMWPEVSGPVYYAGIGLHALPAASAGEVIMKNKRMTFSVMASAFLVLTQMAYGYYSPNLGRWISRDPIGEVGGTNLYSQSGNDTLSRFDPLGRDPQPSAEEGSAAPGEDWSWSVTSGPSGIDGHWADYCCQCVQQLLSWAGIPDGERLSVSNLGSWSSP